MKRVKRICSLQEKLQALHSVKHIGLTRTSRELGMSVTALQKWRNQFEEFGEAGLVGANKAKDPQQTLINKLQRELAQYKSLLAEKELTIRIQEELLKKSLPRKKSD